MSDFGRRSFVGWSGLAFIALAVRDALLGARHLAARSRGASEADVPWKVRQVLERLFGDRPIRDGHGQLDVPAVAADGRVVPIMIESDFPMSAELYVRAVHLLVDNTYCNGGLESSHVYFALPNLLGYLHLRVYDGSFTEWSERTELPVAVGERP